MKIQVLLNEDGTFSRRYVFEENIGKQGRLLAELAANTQFGVPVKLGREDTWDLFLMDHAEANEYVLYAITEQPHMKRVRVVSEQGAEHIWRLPRHGETQPTSIVVPVRMTAAPGSRIVLTVTVNKSNYAAGAPYCFQLDKNGAGVAPLPNVFAGGSICQGGESSFASGKKNVGEIIANIVRGFCDRESNDHLVDARDIALMSFAATGETFTAVIGMSRQKRITENPMLEAIRNETFGNE